MECWSCFDKGLDRASGLRALLGLGSGFLALSQGLRGASTLNPNRCMGAEESGVELSFWVEGSLSRV